MRQLRSPEEGHHDDDEDFNLDRIRLKAPGPIPEDEARWIWEWMTSWGVLHGQFDVTTQINRTVQRQAHELAAAALAGRRD
jgi:hypothetical protein